MTAFLPSDPVEPLDAAALGKALGNLTAETVQELEQHGELFSIVRPLSNRGREYPAFQAWPGITGKPLTQVLAILAEGRGPAAYGFFTSPNPELERLTPIEVLIGCITNARELGSEFTSLLEVPDDQRLHAVLSAAEAYAADLAA